MSFSKDHFVQLQAENTAENKFNFDMQMFEVNQETQTVNLTKIAKHLNKRLDVWLKSKNTKAFIQAYSTLTPNGGIRTLSGFSGEQGTFADRKVALKFAQWVSPEFEIYCLEKLDTLFQTGKVELQPAKSKLQMLKESNKSLSLAIEEIEEKEKIIAKQNTQIDQLMDRNIETMKLKATETRTGINNIKKDIGVEINVLVNSIFKHIDTYADRHRIAHRQYQLATGKTYLGASLASLDSKVKYKDWLMAKQAQNEPQNQLQTLNY